MLTKGYPQADNKWAWPLFTVTLLICYLALFMPTPNEPEKVNTAEVRVQRNLALQHEAQITSLISDLAPQIRVAQAKIQSNILAGLIPNQGVANIDTPDMTITFGHESAGIFFQIRLKEGLIYSTIWPRVNGASIAAHQAVKPEDQITWHCQLKKCPIEETLTILVATS